MEIRQQSIDLRISYENLLAAVVQEEIVRKIYESDYAEVFWLKDYMNLNLDYYRENTCRSLSFYIKEIEKFHYKKSDIYNVFSKIFRNVNQESIQWDFYFRKEQNTIYASLTGEVSKIKVPFRIKFEQIPDRDLTPSMNEIPLFSNNNQKVTIRCFPDEYVMIEKFLDILEKLEFVNDFSIYMNLYEILRRQPVSGRKVWELLNKSCKKRGIPIEPQRFELLASYRTSSYMKKKWKAYLRHEKKTEPSWEEVTRLIDAFFSNIWKCMCQDVFYLGDWIPELGRFMD